MDRPTGASERAGAGPANPPTPTAEPRQRWRIAFARDAPSDRPHRETADEWIAGLQQCGLPLPRTDGRPRPPLVFAAPLPVGVGAQRELADMWLARRLPLADVREALVRAMPSDLRLIDLHDVWLGTPALAAALVAADYRVMPTGDAPAPGELAAAAQRLLASPSLERQRSRGGGTVRYDLRPLVEAIVVEPGPPPAIRIRTRFHPERGAGRPEEVLAALGELLGRPIVASATVRERLILEGDDQDSAVAASTRRPRK